MSICSHSDELTQAIRGGQWPEGCTSELRAHVANCASCTDQAQLLLAFATARTSAMQTAPVQSPELLWWKAQLRRRREAMERLERPGLAISAASIVASVVVLLGVLASAWRYINWSRLADSIAKPVSSHAVLFSCAAAVVAFAVALTLGLADERA